MQHDATVRNSSMIYAICAYWVADENFNTL